tara:strand:- start:301 stop:504 length:204 start_codon:yes stop_codon:yes gene_type:complete
MSREKDIQELCNQVLTASLIPESGDSGYTQCPFCLAEGLWNDDEMNEITHKSTCAYLIAKDLSTNGG